MITEIAITLLIASAIYAVLKCRETAKRLDTELAALTRESDGEFLS